MRREMEKNKMTNGGYCSFNCKHFYEEFLYSGGMIVGDFDSEGVVEYYCNLGHSVAIGNFCKDYEWIAIKACSHARKTSVEIWKQCKCITSFHITTKFFNK